MQITHRNVLSFIEIKEGMLLLFCPTRLGGEIIFLRLAFRNNFLVKLSKQSQPIIKMLRKCRVLCVVCTLNIRKNNAFYNNINA